MSSTTAPVSAGAERAPIPGEASARVAAGILLALLAVAFQLGCDPGAAARVDSCLDRGGSYDYELDECDLERSHPGPGADQRETAAPETER